MKNRLNDDIPMAIFRLEASSQDGVRAGNIVGAIANEAGLDSHFIRKLKINNDFSTVELPADISKEAFQTLQKTRAGGKQLRLKRLSKAQGADKDRSTDSQKPSRHSKNKKRSNTDNKAKPAPNATKKQKTKTASKPKKRKVKS